MSRSFLFLAVDAVWSIKPMNIRHALIAAFLTFATGLKPRPWVSTE